MITGDNGNQVHSAWREFLGRILEKERAPQASFDVAVMNGPVFGRLFGFGKERRESFKKGRIAMVVMPQANGEWLVKLVSMKKLGKESVMTPVETYREVFLRAKLAFETRKVRMDTVEIDMIVTPIVEIYNSLSDTEKKQMRAMTMSPDFLVVSPDL